MSAKSFSVSRDQMKSFDRSGKREGSKLFQSKSVEMKSGQDVTNDYKLSMCKFNHYSTHRFY